MLREPQMLAMSTDEKWTRRQTLQALAAAAIAVTVPSTAATAAEDVQVITVIVFAVRTLLSCWHVIHTPCIFIAAVQDLELSHFGL